MPTSIESIHYRCLSLNQKIRICMFVRLSKWYLRIILKIIVNIIKY